MNPIVKKLLTKVAATDWKRTITKYVAPKDIANLIILAKTYQAKRKNTQEGKLEMKNNKANEVDQATPTSSIELLNEQVQNHEKLIVELMQAKSEAEILEKKKADKQAQSEKEFEEMMSKFVSDEDAQTKNESISKKLTTLTRAQLMGELRKIGFKTCVTASRAWPTTYFFERGDGTMLILIRTREIDILKTPSKLVELQNDDGKVKVYTQAEGHQFGEYHYSDSKVNVHRAILDIAKTFVANEYVDQAVFCKQGINKKEWSQKYATPIKREAGTSNSELYEAISNGDGEPVYLGDGLWIESNGATYDMGR